MAFTVASIGSLMADVAIFTPRMPITGETLIGYGSKIGPGGKGANVAAALARLGASSLMIGKVGEDDFGRMELRALQAQGVDTSAIGIEPTLQTGQAFIMVNDQKENTILVAMGANDAVYGEYIVSALTAHRERLSAIVIDFEIPEAGVTAAVRFGQANDIPVIVDAGPARPFGPEVWGACTVLTPNEQETAALVGYSIEHDDDALRAADTLLAQGPQIVVLKRGKAGALLRTATETAFVPAFPIEAVDTTGAGDAFTALFTLSMLEGLPLAECVRRGNAAGGLAATRVGTMPALPTRAEVEAFLAARAE